ncbi:MAG: succinoglycan biosynthesis protein ExoH [Polaribacter sp.]|jgi:succinoglycan biosynthesis protein ExoH
MEILLNKEISKRLWVTRYFMVIGIIVLHLPQYQPLSEVESLFEHIKAFFSHGIFRATVPVLTVISGYLVFRCNLQSQPLKLFVKKAKSIFIPLIIWNIPFAIAIYLSQKYNLLSHNFSAELYPIEIKNWVNALTGLFGTPANYPLNFLRDLFAVSLLAPIMWLLLKSSPYLGMAIVLVIYYFNLDGVFVLRNSMLVSFYLGGLAATQNWDLTALDKYANWLLLVFILLCISIVLFGIENKEVLRLLAPFMVWPAMSIMENTKIYNFLYKNSKSSFFTFLAHGPIILIMWFLYTTVSEAIPYYVYWVMSPLVTLFVCIYLARYFKKFFPVVASAVLGGR